MTMRMIWVVSIGLLAAFTVACGNSGSSGTAGGGTGTPQTITGDVSAPNGLIAYASPQDEFRFFAWLSQLAQLGLWPQDAYAQMAGSLPGTSIVQQYEAFLISVTSGGAVQKVVAKQTVSGGSFSFPRDPNTSPDTALVVQAAPLGTAGPVPIGSSGVINAPVVGPLIHLDPATEAAMRQLAADQRLGLLPASHARAYVELVRQFVQDNSTLLDSSVTASVQNIATAPAFATDVQPVLAEIVLAPPVNQPHVQGAYGYINVETRLFVGGAQAGAEVYREIGDGIIVFNEEAGTFEIVGDSLGISQLDTGICLPKAVYTPVQVGGTDTISGVYVFTATNKVILTILKSSDPRNHGTRQIYMNPDATVGIAGGADQTDGDSQLVVLAKMDAQSLSPSESYHVVTLESILKTIPAPVNVLDLQERQQSIQTGIGEATIGPAGTLTINRSVEKLTSTVVCKTPSIPPPVGTKATMEGVILNKTLSKPALSERTGTFATAENGTFTLDGAPLSLHGYWGSHGSVGAWANMRLDLPSPLFPQDYGRVQPGLGILGRPGIGLTASHLTGTFRVFSLSFQEDGGVAESPLAHVSEQLRLNGPHLVFERTTFRDNLATFDGAGHLTLNNPVGRQITLAYFCSYNWTVVGAGDTGSCSSEQIASGPGLAGLNSYSVSPFGHLDLTSSTVSVKGFVSIDGTFFAAVGGTSGDRRLIVGVKQ